MQSGAFLSPGIIDGSWGCSLPRATLPFVDLAG